MSKANVLENFQITYTNARTGIQVGLTPDSKFVDPKKVTNLKCLFLINTKGSNYKPRRNPIEVVALVFTSDVTKGEYLRNLRRGVRKIVKYLNEDDIFHLIIAQPKPTIVIEKADLSDKKFLNSAISEKIVEGVECVIQENDWVDGLKMSYDLLQKHGVAQRLKRIFLFADNMMNIKKKNVKTVMGMVDENAKKFLTLSCIGIGPKFDETLLFDLSSIGRSPYYFCPTPSIIPARVSKAIHGITDCLICRDAHLIMKPMNGLSILGSKLRTTQSKDETITVHLNDLYFDNIRKVVLDLSVKVKEEKVNEFLEFILRFVPADVYDPVKHQEIKGKMRLFLSSSSSSRSSASTNKDKEIEIFQMAKHIQSYADGEREVYDRLRKKNVTKAREAAQSTNRSISRQLGKDRIGHVDKLVRIHSSRYDDVRKCGGKDEDCLFVAKKFHELSKKMDEDCDFAYFSGRDSDAGAWNDFEEQEESSDEELGEEEEGEFDDEDLGEVDLDDLSEDDGEFDDDVEFDDSDEDNSETSSDDEGEEFVIVDDGREFDMIAPEPQVNEGPVVVDAVELVENQQRKIIDVAETLNVPVGIAGNLLKHCKWDNEKLYIKFFDNKEKFCREANVVLSDIPFLQGKGKHEVECLICYDDLPNDAMFALPCKHFFCRECWTKYLRVSVGDGPVCLMSTCPYRGCPSVLDESLWKKLAEPKVLKLYERYLLRSFVDDNPRIKWCPAPDCGKAVFCPDMSVDNVQCECGELFCFKCQLEAHEPASCESLRQWKIKEKDESETANWLMVNTKICPGCKKTIEKNGGCNHMTCGQCRYEFCWICLDDWKLHGSKTGGYYQCNRFDEDELKHRKNQGAIDDARAALEKYNHYFTRYATHLNSQKFEIEMKNKAEEKMKKLQLIHRYSSWSDVEYISKAINQLCSCRRALKYTYIHAYFLDNPNLKRLFEFMQQDLERETERLSGLLEEEIEKFDRDQIISSSKSAQTRLKHLLEGSKEGLMYN